MINKAILKFETKKNLLGAVIFSITWLALIALFLMFFGTIKDSAEEFIEAYKNFEDIFIAFSGDINALMEIRGFYNVEIFSFLHLSMNIYAAYKGVSMIGKEITDKSLLFVLAKPISRLKIFTSKILAILLPLLLINIILCFGSALIIKLSTQEEVPLNYLINIYLGAFLLSTVFANLGALFGIILDESKALGASIGVVVISYILNLIGNLPNVTEILGKISLHKYFDVFYVAQNNALKFPEIYVIMVSIIITFILGAISFKRKNIDI